jgi:hypothetical protein
VTTMTKEEFAASVATLVAAMQVPVSIMGARTVMGPGEEAWTRLMALANHGFGWTNADALEAEFRKVLDLKPKVDRREPPGPDEIWPQACPGKPQCEHGGKWGATGILPPGHVWQWRNDEHTSGYLAHLQPEDAPKFTEDDAAAVNAEAGLNDHCPSYGTDKETTL